MTTLEGTFALTGWQEDAYEQSPTKLTYATIGQAWKGDAVEADVECRNLMHYAPDGTATFVGLMRFTGTIGDRSGSFVAQGIGAYDGSTVQCDLTVTPGSGTGDFEGLSGTGTSAAPKGPEGTWTLDLA
jgi:hypothetical protein